MKEEQEHFEGQDRDGIYSNAVRAGKRTYFFDVRKTKSEEFYLTITESKRKYNEDGTFFYQKHKIFLYKEDFDKFTDALHEVVAKVLELNAQGGGQSTQNSSNSSTDISFESL